MGRTVIQAKGEQINTDFSLSDCDGPYPIKFLFYFYKMRPKLGSGLPLGLSYGKYSSPSPRAVPRIDPWRQLYQMDHLAQH